MGDTILNHEYNAAHLTKTGSGIAVSVPGHIPPIGAVYPGQAELGRHLIASALQDTFDVASLREFTPLCQTIPHAYGFVYRQIMGDCAVPSVPVFIDTSYAPNQPTVRRCHEFGKSIVRPTQSWKSNARVALIASGGISHLVIDEQVDQIKFQLQGSVTGLPQLSANRRIAGRVITVKLGNAKDVTPVPGTKPRHLGTTAIEAAERGEVIVVEQRTGLDVGSWGGILTLAAKLRGVAGIVADGPVRDIDEARQYDFPMFARGTTTFTARGRVAEVATNVPVAIGDVTVHPGDYVIADNSAVVFIRLADIERVLEAAELIAEREAAMAKALLAGQPVTEVMGASYEYMLHK